MYIIAHTPQNVKNTLIIFLLIGCFISIFNTIGYSQQPTPTPQVVVSQTFVDDATKAFTEVVVLRDTVNKFMVERAKTDAEREGAKILIASLNEAIAVRDKIHDANLQLIAIYDKIIKIQNDIIDKLSNQLNKPKGFFSKLLDKIKEVALLATGIILGRGL